MSGRSFRFGDARGTRTWAPPDAMVRCRPFRRGSAAGPAGERPASHARPGGNPGRRLSGEQTDGAADTQEVDVTAPDEQRVRNTHESRITCNEPGCPGSVQHVDGAKGLIRRHTRGNMPDRRSYSR